jgi:hypothetical protein
MLFKHNLKNIRNSIKQYLIYCHCFFNLFWSCLSIIYQSSLEARISLVEDIKIDRKISFWAQYPIYFLTDSD